MGKNKLKGFVCVCVFERVCVCKHIHSYTRGRAGINNDNNSPLCQMKEKRKKDTLYLCFSSDATSTVTSGWY